MALVKSLNRGPVIWIAPLVAGAITPLAFAPFEFSLLIFPALMVLFHHWLTLPSKQALRSGYLFGLGLFGVGCSWVFVSMYNYGGLGMAGSLLATSIFVAILALYPAGASWLAVKLRDHCHRPWQQLLLVASLWAGCEMFRGWFLTGFSWLNSGTSQLEMPLSGFAPLLGVYGVSWLVAFSAGLLLLWAYQRQQGWRFGIVFILLWLSAGLLQSVEWTEAEGESIQVSAMQGNVGLDVKWLPEQRSENFNIYAGLTDLHWKSDLVLWPETAMTAFLHQVDGEIDQFIATAQETETTVITGIPVYNQESDQYYNALVAFNKGETALYYKRHLVPFGEYIPFESVLGRLLEFMSIPMSSFTAGSDQQETLRGAGLNIGASICYEIAFAEEMIQSLPKANLLVNVSNDTWFDGSLAPYQHLQMARMRALESERWIVRATNTGISAIIDDKGVVREVSPQNEVYVVSGEVQPRSGATPYVMWGNWPIWLLIVSSLLWFGGRYYRARAI
ncbi:MAG: apolipoprotein N-acyltransferase [Gammaproteobacteria bacterium]|nr:apolipoprotein N-acyltransferase [Gammaproteobacteria bacterium]MCF6229347.1 apolipoprotein N-acyltransferase [Gammaproteobacteria bacterium]